MTYCLNNFIQNKIQNDFHDIICGRNVILPSVDHNEQIINTHAMHERSLPYPSLPLKNHSSQTYIQGHVCPKNAKTVQEVHFHIFWKFHMNHQPLPQTIR